MTGMALKTLAQLLLTCQLFLWSKEWLVVDRLIQPLCHNKSLIIAMLYILALTDKQSNHLLMWLNTKSWYCLRTLLEPLVSDLILSVLRRLA